MKKFLVSFLFLALFIGGCKNKDSKKDVNSNTAKTKKPAKLVNTKEGLASYLKGTKLQSKGKFSEAFEAFKKACDLKSPKGCRMAGMDSLMGFGTKKDPKKSVEYYEKGCDLKDGPSCFSVAKLFKSGFGSIKKDSAKAQLLLKKACDLKNTSACRMLKK